MPLSLLMPIVLRNEIPHYQEYLLASRTDPVLSYVLEQSDPEKVREFDTLVGQANVYRDAALVNLQSGGTQSDFYAEKLLELSSQAISLIDAEI